jgi:hypothetical protein
LNLYPFFPEKMSELFQILNLNDYMDELNNWNLQVLRDKEEVFTIKENASILFSKFEID